jgi:hypothetical protein
MAKLLNEQLWNEWNGGTTSQDLYHECGVAYIRWLKAELLKQGVKDDTPEEGLFDLFKVKELEIQLLALREKNH